MLCRGIACLYNGWNCLAFWINGLIWFWFRQFLTSSFLSVCIQQVIAEFHSNSNPIAVIEIFIARKWKRRNGCLFYYFNSGKIFISQKKKQRKIKTKIRQLNAKKDSHNNILCIKISHRRRRLFVLNSFRFFAINQNKKESNVFLVVDEMFNGTKSFAKYCYFEFRRRILLL